MNKEEMIGQRFGRLTVIEQDFEYQKNRNLKTKQNYWKCKCDCGEEKTIVQASLTGGKTKSCGCLNQEKRLRQKENLMGQTFGYLTVISPAENVGNRTAWLCQCKCGRQIVVRATHLKSGNTKSCGCRHNYNYSYNRNHELCVNIKKDLTGKIFGKLTVLYPTEKRNNGFVVWMCKCECGNMKEATSTHLIRGYTSSCGCIVSKGENNIINILQKNSIKYETQKTFKDFFEIKGHPYRYDFYLPDYNRLIEFDGIQHYESNKSKNSWNTEEKVVKTQKRDKLKNEYALSHNIPLVRIPYWERDNITLDMLLGDKCLIQNNNEEEEIIF